ncbi:hypothetical protein ACIP5U_37300 [Streptomyces sp. NPDC088788]|uniref:hypothetical protein n=1 Tax=Streptomyces sp. NPDC088788 TaxID=3365898 RepID=UPI0037F2D2CB
MTGVLLISDSAGDDPAGLGPCRIPVQTATAALFTFDQLRSAALVILDDRVFQAFTARRMPRRQDLVVVNPNPDDATVWSRAVTLGATHVVTTHEGSDWLHLKMHAATDCQFADWESLLGPGPDGPAQPVG